MIYRHCSFGFSLFEMHSVFEFKQDFEFGTSGSQAARSSLENVSVMSMCACADVPAQRPARRIRPRSKCALQIKNLLWNGNHSIRPVYTWSQLPEFNTKLLNILTECMCCVLLSPIKRRPGFFYRITFVGSVLFTRCITQCTFRK